MGLILEYTWGLSKRIHVAYPSVYGGLILEDIWGYVGRGAPSVYVGLILEDIWGLS